MASATEAPATDLGALLSARRTEDQARRRRRLYLGDLITSLWAPVTALAAALVPYLLVVELHPPSASWAEPGMRRLGFLFFLWFAGLVVWRLAAKNANLLRRRRHDAREATADVEGTLRTGGAALEPKARDRLVEQAARVETAMLGDDAAELEKQTRALVDLGAAIPGSRRHGMLELGAGLFKALLVALLIRAVLIEPFKIPSGSMLPTLEIGDQIFVNKFIYGVRIPFTNWVPFSIVRKPERGDVIVFNNPMEPEKDYIKRVVGIPGDVVEVHDDVLFINGREEPRRLVSPAFESWEAVSGPRFFDLDRWYPSVARLYQENLDGHLHAVLQVPPDRKRGGVPTGPFRVPEGAVFVMGDNRDNSSDSRLGLGDERRGIQYVPYGNIKGKAMIIWLSLGHGGLFSGLTGGTGIRTDRFFHPVR